MMLFLFLASALRQASALHAPVQLATPPIVLAAAPDSAPDKTKKSGVPPMPGSDVLCSLEVSSMSPAQILQILSVQTHANLVLLTSPETKLTIRLTHVPLAEMIRHICAMCDLSFLCVGKTYVIAAPDRLKTAYPSEWLAAHPISPVQPPAAVQLSSETYNASYVTSSQLGKALEKLFPSKDIAFVPGPSPSSPEIGSQDGAKATGTSTAILAKSDSTESTSRILVISGPSEMVAAALAMARQLDQPRRQVSIQVTISDISADGLKDLGVTWDFGNMTITESQGKGVNFGKISRSPLSFASTLSALEQNGSSKLLAKPNISVLDGERAFVLIGNRIAYPVLVGYSQNNAPIFSKEEERVGIYLQVSASIGQDGSVTISLYPQVSTITGYLTVNGASYPQVSTREAQTTIRVQSGDTIAMGGLFSDEDIASVEKVPLLSQIPILGQIFQHRKITKSHSDVVITVTPTVINATPK